MIFTYGLLKLSTKCKAELLEPGTIRELVVDTEEGEGEGLATGKGLTIVEV